MFDCDILSKTNSRLRLFCSFRYFDTDRLRIATRCDIILAAASGLRFLCSLRYGVNKEERVATIELVAIIFNFDLVVAIFSSMRHRVNIELRNATI